MLDLSKLLTKLKWSKLSMKQKAWLIGAVLGLAVGIAACSKFWDSYRDDNIVEEITEEVIEHYTGIDLDLSPQTPEK